MPFSKFTPSDKEPSLVDQLCSQYKLNAGQQRAFHIITLHVEQGEKRPLRMYVGGAAGTGKSTLIHAVTDFFGRKGSSQRLRLTSYMGVAAKNINGMTLHSALQLSQKHRSSTATNNLIAMWQGVDYLLVDEVSMLGCNFLAELSESLSIAKGNPEAFRGMNVIFLGDFAQLPPVGQSRLFTHLDTQRISNKIGQLDMFGKLLWLSVDVIIILQDIV